MRLKLMWWTAPAPGIDVPIRGDRLAKNVFQMHGVDANDRVVFNKPLRRSQVLPFFAELAPCLIGIEAYGSLSFLLHRGRRP
jgi:transposase